MNAVPNLSQKPLRLRAMAAPSGTPMSSESAMLIRPIYMEMGAFCAMMAVMGVPAL